MENDRPFLTLYASALLKVWPFLEFDLFFTPYHIGFSQATCICHLISWSHPFSFCAQLVFPFYWINLSLKHLDLIFFQIDFFLLCQSDSFFLYTVKTFSLVCLTFNVLMFLFIIFTGPFFLHICNCFCE